KYPRLKGLRVLVVDNDERVRRSAHSLLGRFGCTVETASTAKEALTMARLSTYDAVLADIRLPDMSGHDIYTGLRKAQPHARVVQAPDMAATCRHLDAVLAAGVHGFIMLGTVGENCSLEYREKLDVLKATVEHIGKRVSVLTGVAECTTTLACRFAADAKK